MTSLDKVEPASIDRSARATPGNHVAIELRETLRLALPMALTQLGQIAMMTTDLALVGRLGDQAVAAAALASTVYFVSFTVGMGLVSAVSPLAAQAFGARNPRMVRRALRVGLWAALLISLPMLAFPLRGEQILLALGQAPASVHLAQQYLFGLAWGIAPALWFIAIRGFMGAVNRPEPVLWITLAAIPANGVLVYLLIHGAWGLPRLELFGAGLATSLVNVGSVLAALWFVIRRRPFRKYHAFGRIWRIDWSLMRKLVIVGAPISISLLLEYGLFGAAGLLMGVISTTALAAHQIALQVTAILFMVPLGISMAATVRVGHAVGRNDADGVRRAGFVAILLGIALVAALTLAVIASRDGIAHLFFGAAADGAGAAISLVETLLVIGATFFIADGIQTIAAGALRGMNDTRVPLLFAVVSYWLIGFASAWWLAFSTPLGARGVWIGLSIGTAVYAALLVWRFDLLSKRMAIHEGR
ncbi:MATE family efflux transporter [Bradyrhizobium lablabi]|uniref:MATE family efflux transporter n=1 Tax=Bradyrhizobium lablabi TaxID=722472 RepID=UPI001BA47096|nr:MATE family efflux transporter [Bradyrhizobium lablabi]MBR1124481.1 MATE family efflux transporter [Bradyrhizobium lablabi]